MRRRTRVAASLVVLGTVVSACRGSDPPTTTGDRPKHALLSQQQVEALCKAARPGARFDLYNISTAGQVVDLVHRLGLHPADAKLWSQLDPATAVAWCGLQAHNGVEKSLVVDREQRHVRWLTVRVP